MTTLPEAFKVPEPAIVHVPSDVVLKIVELQIVFNDSVIPVAIPTPFAALTVNVPGPEIVDVPLFAVVIVVKDRDTSILSVPPALMVTAVPAVIVLA